MTRKIELMEISELRGLLAYACEVSGDGPAPNDAVQVAHDTVQTMCQEAARYGLTTADVVRAILRPVFERKRSCECPGCKSRRSEADSQKPEQVSTPVT